MPALGPNNYPAGAGGGASADPSYAAAERASKMRDYETLCQIIQQWNANRLDLFALTLPNEVRENEDRPVLQWHFAFWG